MWNREIITLKCPVSQRSHQEQVSEKSYIDLLLAFIFHSTLFRRSLFISSNIGMGTYTLLLDTSFTIPPTQLNLDVVYFEKCDSIDFIRSLINCEAPLQF